MADLLAAFYQVAPRAVLVVAYLGLAAWLLWLDFRSRVHRAFALLLLLRGLSTALGFLPDSEGGLGDRVNPYFDIAIPFAAAYFGLRFLRLFSMPRGVSGAAFTRVAGGILLVATMAFESLYVRDHALFYVPTQPAGPLYVFGQLDNLAFALVASLFAWACLRNGLRLPRRALMLGSLGFTLDPLWGSSFGTAQLVALALGSPRTFRVLMDQPVNLAVACVDLATVLVLAFAAGRLVLAARRHGNGSDARLHGFLAVLAALTGTVLGVWAAFGTAATAQMFVRANILTQLLWRLTLPVLVAYAIARRQLFGLDVKVRFALEKSTIAALFFSVFFMVSETPQALVSSGVGGIDSQWGTYVGLAAAGLLVFFLHPLQRFAERLGRTAMPGAEPLSELGQEERGRIYREQAELAWMDGVLQRKERLLLDQLRQRLNLDSETAAEIESAVVGGIAGRRLVEPPGPAAVRRERRGRSRAH